MAQKKRQVSAQTRVKLSQAAKKRHRGLKGTPLGGKFAAGAAPSFGGAHFMADQSKQHGTSGSHVREVYNTVRADAARTNASNPARVERDLAYYRTKSITGVEDLRHADTAEPPLKVRSAGVREAEQAFRQANWRKGGTYRSTSRKTPARFLKEETPESHQKEVSRLLQDPNSPLRKGTTESGSRNRLRQYTDRLQQGDSHEDALAYASQAGGERRGRKATGRATAPGRTRKAPVRKSKFESAAPKDNEMQFGISAPRADTLDELRGKMPNASDRDIVQVQQTQRQDIFSDMQTNVKWAHETRQANIEDGQVDRKGGMGKVAGEKSKEGDGSKVTFFTTSLGSPAPSVPADSLIGQYIVRRRVNMMKQAGVPASQLKGEFPRAVRDMHLLEWSTGVSLGAEGRAGVYKETGWRKNTKTSKGFNKPVPLGSHVLYDSQGTPLYDAQGNVMYSEGATRGARWDTPRVGLKIFIG